ncbi:hypothetical protein [Knoellia sinensis]|uniref:hypothetical protein n=1 Tax=Knoellia sinensis TaxID=136100 RepID=UPI0012EC5B9D|nr:hypothetical protein [Knoellia sinensis]
MSSTTAADVVEVTLDSGPQPRVGPVLVVGGIGTGALAGVGMSMVAMQTDQPTWAVMFVALTLLMVLVGGTFLMGALPTKRGKLRVRAHDDALEVVGSPWVRWAEVATAAFLWMGVVGGAILLLGPVDSDPQTVGPIVILVGFALATTWFAARFLSGHRPPDAVMLRRDGFSTLRAGSTTSFSWGDVLGFGVGNGGMTVDLLGYGGISARFPASELPSDPALVAALLEFYRTHQFERSELASGRVLDRIRSGDFRRPARPPAR